MAKVAKYQEAKTGNIYFVPPLASNDEIVAVQCSVFDGAEGEYAHSWAGTPTQFRQWFIPLK